MKILIFNWRDIKNPKSGGAEVHLHEIARRLASKDHEIVLVTSKFEDCKEIETIEGVQVIRIENKWIFNLTAFWYYLSNLRNEEFDLIVEDISKVPLYTPLYIRKPLIGIIHHIHGKTLFKELSFLKACYVYLSEKLIPFIYKKIPFITVSKSTKKELAQMNIPKENIRIIPNGVNHNLCKYGSEAENPTIVYFGRVKKYKRIGHLLKAFKLLEKTMDDVRLIIAGKGDANSRLKELAEQMNIENIKIYGKTSNKEKIELLQKGWVFVTPSMKEGWGITVIEANACGTPCIAYSVPGLRDSIIDGETGFLVEDRNIQELAKTIGKVLTNEDLRKKLRENALNWSKIFTWSKSAANFEKMLEEFNDTVSLEQLLEHLKQLQKGMEETTPVKREREKRGLSVIFPVSSPDLRVLH